MAYFNKYVKPGALEVYVGPMFSGKTAALIDRIKRIKEFVEGYDVLIIKPKIDTRDKGLKSKNGKEILPAIFLPEDKPELIIDQIAIYYKKNTPKYLQQGKTSADNLVIAIDEVQFFDKSIVGIVDRLVLNNYNVLVSGLPLDFKGESFGCMPDLMAIEDEIYSFTAVCAYPGCNNAATRTQRLINGEPAHYDSDVNIIEGSDKLITYEARCRKHHFVPGKK